MSMNGITISPRMMNVGSTTPACQGSKKTSISWRPRKYHGAFDGFGVRAGLAGSSMGALRSRLHHEDDHADHHGEELGVDQVRPHPGLLALAVRGLARGLPGRQPVVVLVGLRHAQ